MDNSHQHQHSAWTGGRHPNSSTATSASPDRVLEDTMSRFGSMSLTGGGMGALSAPGGGQQQQQVLVSRSFSDQAGLKEGRLYI